MSELTVSGTGLRQQFRDSELQQRLREQESRFQRHAAHGRPGRDVDCRVVQRFVKKPVRFLLENLGDDLQQALGRDALAVFDHRQVGNGGAGLGVDLHATYRQVFQREVVPLA